MSTPPPPAPGDRNRPGDADSPDDDPHRHLQRLVDGLLELNCVLQMAHDRLEELRDMARFAGYQADCVNLVVRLDELRDGVNRFKQTLVDQQSL